MSSFLARSHRIESGITLKSQEVAVAPLQTRPDTIPSAHHMNKVGVKSAELEQVRTEDILKSMSRSATALKDNLVNAELKGNHAMHDRNDHSSVLCISQIRI